MTDLLADGVELPRSATTDALGEQPIATKRVIPWEDLGAQLVPETYLRVIPELLPTLSAGMAQGPTSPVLLQADALKRLQVAADLNPVQLLAGPAAVNDVVLTVQRPAAFHVGQLVRVLPVTAAGVLSATGEYHVVTAINAATIGISPAMNAGAGVGSLVVTQATVGLSTPDRKLGSFNAPLAQVTQQSFQLDPDVQGVRIIFDNPNNVAQLTLLGASGIIYQAPLQRNVDVDNIYRFPSALEGSVNVRVSTAAGGGTNVFVLAVYDVQNVVNDPRPASIQNVQLVNSSGVGLNPLPTDPSDRMARLLGHTIVDSGSVNVGTLSAIADNIARLLGSVSNRVGYQGDAVPFVSVLTANVAANTTATFTAGGTGSQRVWLLGYTLDLDATTATAGVGGLLMQIRDTVGANSIHMSAAVLHHNDSFPLGWPSSTGASGGWQFYNGTGVTLTIRASLLCIIV